MTKSISRVNPLSPAMEDYLEAIYHIIQEHGRARSFQISERLGVHKSTVTTALHSLQAQGYIDYAPYKDVTMTAKGEKEALGIVSRHDIFFRLLHDLLGVEKEEASSLACEMEHSIPPHIVDRFIHLVEEALQQKKSRNTVRNGMASKENKSDAKSSTVKKPR